MDKDLLQKSYEFLTEKYEFYKSFTDYDSQKIIQDQLAFYLSENPKLTKYISSISGSGNPDEYLREFLGEIKYFERDLPRILKQIKIDISKIEEGE